MLADVQSALSGRSQLETRYASQLASPFGRRCYQRFEQVTKSVQRSQDVEGELRRLRRLMREHAETFATLTFLPLHIFLSHSSFPPFAQFFVGVFVHCIAFFHHRMMMITSFEGEQEWLRPCPERMRDLRLKKLCSLELTLFWHN